jgi:hypothetical protein
MADQFGASATDLQAPSGGLNPVAPVQEQLPPSPVPDAIRTLGSVFTEGITGAVKQQALDAKTAVLKSVSDPIGQLNVLFSSGQISNDQYTVRSQSIYNAAVASHPELAGEIAGVSTAFKGTTVAGTVADNQKAAADLRNKNLDAAQGQGYLITKDMTPQQQDVIIQASQSNIAMNQFLDRQAKVQAYAVSSNTLANNQFDRQHKEQATQILTQIAANDTTSLSAEFDGLRKAADATNDPNVLRDLQNKWAQRIAQSKNVLTAAGQYNPEMASAYKSNYDAWEKMGDQLDPAKRSADIDNQIKTIVGKAQLVGLQDPQTAALAASQKLFPNNPGILLSQTAQVSKAITAMAGTPYTGPSSTIGVPPVVGTPDEKGAWSAMKQGLTALGQDTSKDPQSQDEAGNMINHAMHNVGDMLTKGASAAQLKQTADFFASPEYAGYVKTGKVSPDAAQAAQKTLQTIYYPAVTQAVGNTLAGPVGGDSDKKVRDVVTATYDGGGIHFVPRDGLTAQEQAEARSTIKNLAPAVAGLNTVTRIGTHLEGGTDYAKNWEANKYDYLPQLYPVRPGQVVNGKKFIGGDYRDPNSWSNAGGAR